MNKKPLLSDGWEEFYNEPYPEKSDDDTVVLYCGRCGGSGFLSYYAGIDSGRCWGCDATGGKYTETVSFLRLKEMARAKSQARKINKAEATKQKGLDWLKGRKVEEAFTWGKARDIEFFWNVYGTLITKGKISKNQEDAILEAFSRGVALEEAEAQRVKVSAPEGKMTVVGTVVSIKAQENIFSYHGGSTMKMLVVSDEGWKTFGTVPSSILTDLKVSDRVKFTATIKPSVDDAEFSYFSRPSKASIIDNV